MASCIEVVVRAAFGLRKVYFFVAVSLTQIVRASIPISILPSATPLHSFLPPGSQNTYQVPSNACGGSRYTQDAALLS
jgi:hypothetical protein